VILAYDGTLRWTLRYQVLTASARLLDIPLVVELSEAPWAVRARGTLWERVFSPLALTDGAITISRFLTSWASTEYASRRSLATATEVPIIVDVDESRPSPYPWSTKTALYAVSPGYDDSLIFILDAMRHVWTSEPSCQLVVTGIAVDQLDIYAKLRPQLSSDLEAARVRAVGRVSRDALLRLYSEANVCLAPLFDDQRSKARFPTKIAEYAAAARPVVTSSVGEVKRYLEDGDTAFIAEPGDAAAFGRKIVEVLADPAAAAAVGVRARGLAEKLFDYRVHAARLHEALANTPAVHSRVARHRQ
jgi:glycosyltransferase involved in cell wall biosynthesis